MTEYKENTGDAVRLEELKWRDLVPLKTGERLWELCLPLPWFAVSLLCYESGWWWAGLACSFYFFLTGLRLSHNAQHCSLGVGRSRHDLILFALSVLMLASMHAVRVTHLHHHRHCLEDEDTEGTTARLPWYQALLIGPLFYFRLHRSAWRLAPPSQCWWIAVELCGLALVIVGVFCSPWMTMRWHFAAMLLGECFTGFFAVWSVHHDCEPGDAGRTQRGRWINRLSYSMFFHAEHHLFPAVPTIHLVRLAERLDAASPAVPRRLVIPRSKRFLNKPR